MGAWGGEGALGGGWAGLETLHCLLVPVLPWVRVVLGEKVGRRGGLEALDSSRWASGSRVVNKYQICSQMLPQCPHTSPPSCPFTSHPCLADRFGNDAPAIERICRAPRYALRSAGKAAAPALAQMVHSLPRRFEVSRHSAFLWVASEIIKIFGDESARDAELGEWHFQC